MPGIALGRWHSSWTRKTDSVLMKFPFSGLKGKANKHINPQGISARDEGYEEHMVGWWGSGGSRNDVGLLHVEWVSLSTSRAGPGMREHLAGRWWQPNPQVSPSCAVWGSPECLCGWEDRAEDFGGGTDWELVRVQITDCGLYANCNEKTVHIFSYRGGMIWLIFLNGHCGFCRLSGS